VKKIVFLFVFVFQSSNVSAEIIYQWTDPWGQKQYSKTPVPGAMVSDLTELPVQQATTEQQKQEAMLKKLQQINQDNIRFAQIEAARQVSKIQAQETHNQCQQLQNLAAEVQTASLRYFSMTGFIFIPNYFDHLQSDIAREMRQKCRK